jgi:hypothetical protein
MFLVVFVTISIIDFCLPRISPFDLNSQPSLPLSTKMIVKWKKCEVNNKGNLLNTLDKYRKWIVILFYKFNDSWNGARGKRQEEENDFSFIKKYFWFGLLLFRVLLRSSDKFNFKCVTCTATERKEIVVELNVTTRHLERNLFSWKGWNWQVWEKRRIDWLLSVWGMSLETMWGIRWKMRSKFGVENVILERHVGRKVWSFFGICGFYWGLCLTTWSRRLSGQC